MDEETNQGVEQDAHQDSPSYSSQNSHEESANESQDLQNQKANDSERNWAEMRRKMREKDHQIEELTRKFEQIADRRPTQEERDELAELAEDDILTVAQAKKLVQKMALSEAEKYYKKESESQLEDRLRLRYRDYDDVVTKENIELFLEQERELADTLKHISDPYKQAESAYKMLKKFGTHSVRQDKKRAEENSKKPVSVQAVTKSSAIGDAHRFENGLSKELKDQLWKEMQQSMKFG